MKILLLNNDKVFTDKFLEIVNATSGYEMAGNSDNGMEGLDIINKTKPDVIIMDLLLSGLDGFGILKSIDCSRTKVILLTAVNSEDIILKAFAMGVCYVMLKPVKAEVVIDRIKDIVNPVTVSAQSREFSSTESVIEEKHTDARKKISKMLNDVGITPNLKGFRYIRSAVLMVVGNEEIIESVTKTIYPTIGDEYNTTAVRVERAIRHAIESAWERDGGETIKKIFSLPENTKRLTNSEFIGLASEYISG